MRPISARFAPLCCFALIFFFCFSSAGLAQAPAPSSTGVGPSLNVGVPPAINVGGGDFVFSQIQAIEFNQMNIEAQEKQRKAREEQLAQQTKMVNDGLISAL
ncbi:MAG: hypothetical protein JO041_16350, partial [Acidobacteria bacterium]|nr:hypothetical protein [Acidobacteriota bacterium]